ncbi:Crp/Fnr family transcriptional regulator [Flavobacterium sp. CFBP9031]|jgi:signal-transduction protein with cAMP-binding, CBS, and nucleotidyltransferase domain|uniref:Crp/Fnr family transcriptional regulator n=1 Tax=unclassified Flavobacterium TaxID=196869 RepID=UPI002A6A805B|nr:Crp/Fnr family transcriptional regulator [Flavobacterium sp. CFBP9031]MDY0989302.1 Crp/Fnr family transcriptional regulator [Flavobacterium sp. CFBP9031]
MTFNKETYLNNLKQTIESYYPISEKSWKLIESITSFQTLKKGETLLRNGEIAKNLHFIAKGVLRTFITDEEGNFYNKNLFLENYLAGSKVSLMLQTPSNFTIEALEDSIVININYKKYIEYINENDDLKNFYIAHLERHWIIEKEQREVALVMQNATERYITLLEKHPDMADRVPLLHIASHLGITPTQLSRIRKSLEKDL